MAAQQEVPDVSTIRPLGNMNVRTKCNCNPKRFLEFQWGTARPMLQPMKLNTSCKCLKIKTYQIQGGHVSWLELFEGFQCETSVKEALTFQIEKNCIFLSEERNCWRASVLMEMSAVERYIRLNLKVLVSIKSIKQIRKLNRPFYWNIIKQGILELIGISSWHSWFP